MKRLETMLKKLIKTNQALINEGLVILTWGNASCRTKSGDRMYIKPSGVPFEELMTRDIATVDLKTGRHLKGKKPSVDTPTHLALYNAFPAINSIVHTHSKYCTIFAQAKLDIPCFGTTHADYFYGPIPVVEDLTEEEIQTDYEKNTGLKIIDHFTTRNISPMSVKAALSPAHGVFVWGSSMEEALECAIVLENIAEMAYKTLVLTRPMRYNRTVTCDSALLDKHFLRKHGDKKYYGQ